MENVKEELSDMLDELQCVKREMGDDTLVDVVQEHHFEHALINFDEPMNQYNSRDPYPAINIQNCYIPSPSYSSSSYQLRKSKK
ncbi:MAG: hypothetical protein HFI86_08265 [Bacilli bacterium]|nr:hypothetical protein [Bacilli bacterium]